MEKKTYTIPEFKIVEFERIDILTASGDEYKGDGFMPSAPDNDNFFN